MDIKISKGIKRSKKWTHLVERYVHSHHPDSNKSLFETIKDLMYFAALLGYSNNRRLPLNLFDDDLDDIQAHIFSDDKNVGIIYALGLAVEKDSSILKEENEKNLITIFEEFANGGFQILNDWQRAADNDGAISLYSGLVENGFMNNEKRNDHINEFVNFTFE